MLHRTTGHTLLAIGAFFYASTYLAAAIAVSGDDGFSGVVFRRALEAIGPVPIVLAVACAVMGMGILVRSARAPGAE